MLSQQLRVIVSAWVLGAGTCLAADSAMDSAPVTAPVPTTQAAPAAPTTQALAPHKVDLLGPEFSSETYGLAFRPPVDCIEIHKPSPDTIVEFDQEKNNWMILARQVVEQKALPLTVHKDQFGNSQDGLIEQTLQNIKQNTPEVEIIGADDGPQIINVGAVRVGLIFARFTNAAQQRKLLQEAIIEAPGAGFRLYYFIDFISPARPKDAPADEVDPGEKSAHDAFTQMIDSSKLLDRSKIFDDQRERLFHTHALFVNWGSNHGQPLKSALKPDQWQRIIKDGKDIGYSHTLEGVEDSMQDANGRGIPMTNPNQYAIRIGVRTRIFPVAGQQWDTGTWMRIQTESDWEHYDESWTSTAIDSDAKGKVVSQMLQIGNSHERTHAVAMQPQIDPNNGGLGVSNEKDMGPLGQGANVNITTTRTLSVTSRIDNKTEIQPFKKDVPVFYIPQAISSILPRLLPLGEPKKYMFATFVATPWTDLSKKLGGGEIMMRYVDVLPVQQVPFNGHTIIAVQVTDHIGLTGPVTTNFMSPEGMFLGSVCTYSEGKTPDGTDKQTTVMVLPTNSDALQLIWPHPNFSAPEEAPK